MLLFLQSRFETTYRLRSMVLFYGSHYLAFCHHPTHGWAKFDDTSVQARE